jgi:diguanylate cyclase (GGDEF)-like protein
MMDIDDFQAINDKYGHLVGDMVLKEIAATIQKTIRHVDIAARYGGEEFTIILPETAIYNSVIIAERLRQRIRDIKIRVDNEEISPSVSIGIAEYPNSSNNIKDLINWADKALYMSKNNGKNCIHMYFNEKFERYNPNEIQG